MAPYHVERLPNGLAVAVAPVATTHQVLLTVLVRVGSRFEPLGLNGVSHAVEHLLFRGNARFPDPFSLHRALEEVGALVNAQTGVESTEVDFVAHPERVSEALGCLAALVRSPTFADFEKERGIIADELRYDYNEANRLIVPATLASQLLWPGHSLGQSVGGTPETLAALSPEAVRAHHAAHYRPDNVVVGVAGRIEVAVALAAVREHFGDWVAPAAPPPPLPDAAPAPDAAGPRLLSVPDQDNQFSLQLSFPAPPRRSADEIPVGLLLRILDDGPNSRLQRVIREEMALVYSISAGYTAYEDAGQFDIATAVAPERLETLLRTVFAELSRFAAEGPTAEELETARRRHRLELGFARDSLGAYIDRYAWPLLYGPIREEDEELAEMERVTAERLRTLAADLFRRQRLHLVLVGPRDAASEAALRRAVATF